MKISELIEALQKIHAKYGECEVYRSTYNGEIEEFARIEVVEREYFGAPLEGTDAQFYQRVKVRL
jgi:hypothetical protein